MEHEIDIAHDLIQCGAIADVPFDESDTASEPDDVFSRAGKQIIEDDHLLAFREERSGDVRSDESRSTGDEVRCHGCSGHRQRKD